MRTVLSLNRSGAPLRLRRRSRRRFANCIALCALMLAALLLVACANQRVQRAYTPLILISIDGYRHDYIKRGLSPNIAALSADGVHASSMRASFPTFTFPNHYAIVTGLYPDHSGIVNNRFIDPLSGERFVYNDPKTTADPGWWGGEPLWVGVERSGKHSATVFWPGSDVAIGGTHPELWLPFDGKMSPDARVDQALAWLDLPAGERPDFLTLYFEQVDHAGHDFGPDSREVNAALGDVDHALGRLIDGLRRRGTFEHANIVLVSDHGMTPTSEQRQIVLDDVVAADEIDLVTTGVLAGFGARHGHEAAVERAVLAPHAHMHCWKKSEVPARLHYGANPRIPPLLCLADAGWLISTREHLARPGHHVSLGEHGYDNDEPDMGALFVAHGPAFRHHAEVPQFDNVDLYPLLAKLLGVPPAHNDGNVHALDAALAPERR